MELVLGVQGLKRLCRDRCRRYAAPLIVPLAPGLACTPTRAKAARVGDPAIRPGLTSAPPLRGSRTTEQDAVACDKRRRKTPTQAKESWVGHPATESWVGHQATDFHPAHASCSSR